MNELEEKLPNKTVSLYEELLDCMDQTKMEHKRKSNFELFKLNVMVRSDKSVFILLFVSKLFK